MLMLETVQWLQRAVQQGGLSRAGLARELCERDGWRKPRAKLFWPRRARPCRGWRSSWG